jgi:hypothetical protein
VQRRGPLAVGTAWGTITGVLAAIVVLIAAVSSTTDEVSATTVGRFAFSSLLFFLSGVSARVWATRQRGASGIER